MLLGVDLGGTSVKLGLINPQGEIAARYEGSVAFDGYQTPILTSALRHAEAFLASHPEYAVRGIGISATGQIDTRTGVVIGTNGSIPHYENSPLAQAFTDTFHVPAVALNDANAAVLGECTFGAGRGLHHVLMVTLGTGVGGGVMVDGRLLHGRRGLAGEIGHFPLDAHGIPCSCGSVGCYERYASTTALLRAARQATGNQQLDGKTLFQSVAQGNEALQKVLDSWLFDVAAGLVGLIHIFNPEMVIIGGGVSVQEELLIRPLRQRVLASAMPRFTEGLQITGAALGNDAGMIGAACYMRGLLDGKC